MADYDLMTGVKKAYEAYSPANKPTAADVGAIPTSKIAPNLGVVKWADLVDKIPVISSSGVTELGRYVDLREGESDVDFSWRIDAGGKGQGELTIYNNSAGIPVVKWGANGRMTLPHEGANLYGRTQVISTSNPMIELHIPGVRSVGQYLTNSGDWRFGFTDGAGGETTYKFVSFADGRFLTAGATLNDHTGDSPWNRHDTASFRVNSPRNTVGGNYHKLISHKLQYSGAWVAENSYGAYLDSQTSEWHKLCHTLVSTDGGSTTAIWKFRNDGSIYNPGSYFLPADGNIYSTRWGNAYLWDAAVATFAPASDARLKTVLGDSTESALDKVRILPFKSYTWNKAPSKARGLSTGDVVSIGLIAQDVEAIDPALTRNIYTYDPDGSVDTETKVLDTANLFALTLKAVQEQQEMIDSQNETINLLMARIEALEAFNK